jgi:hypothetical protein
MHETRKRIVRDAMKNVEKETTCFDNNGYSA